MNHYHRLAFHLDILTAGFLAQVLQHVTPLEVLVGVDNSLQLVGAHNALVLGPLDLVLVYVLEDADDVFSISMLLKVGGVGSSLTGCKPYGTSASPCPPSHHSAHSCR